MQRIVIICFFGLSALCQTTSIPPWQGPAGGADGVGAGAEHAGVLCPQLLEVGEERGQDRTLLRHGRAAQVPSSCNVMLLELPTNLREVSQCPEIGHN